MDSTLGSVFSCLLVSLIWGITNPFMKSGVVGVERVKKSSIGAQIIAEIWFLIKSWRYMIPFLINQGGSLLFYITVASSDISMAVPLVNALTLIITIITGKIFGETVNKYCIFGMFLVMTGVSLCMLDKITLT